MALSKKLFHRSIGFALNTLALLYPKAAGSIAYRLFSRPRAGRLAGELPDMLRDAESVTLSNGSSQFRLYRWKNDGPVVLLAHGWESNSWRWEKMLPFLQRAKCTVVAIDAPAHGKTDGLEFNVPAYAEQIRIAVDIYHPSAIVAHSLGGAASVYYSYLYPHTSVKKMVLLGAPSDMDIITGNYFNMLGLNKRVAELFNDEFRKRFTLAPSEFTARVFAADLELEGLIVHDPDDDVVAFGEAEKISSAWIRAGFIKTNRLGHSLHDDELYQRIIDFLCDNVVQP